MLDTTKSKDGTELMIECKVMLNILIDTGLNLKIHILDNECSNTLKQIMTEEEETFQLVPSEIHRRSTA